jgi:AraC-like DNA-binding protein
VAAQTGYESLTAFNRAFKREFGMPPAAWRRQATRPAPTSGKQAR